VGSKCIVLTYRDIVPNLYGPHWPYHLNCFIHFASSTGVTIFFAKNLILCRHKESDQSKNASSLPQRAQSDRSGNEHVRELEQQSGVPSNSGPPDRRQTQSTDVLPSQSGQTKNASLMSQHLRVTNQEVNVFIRRNNNQMYHQIHNLLLKNT